MRYSGNLEGCIAGLVGRSTKICVGRAATLRRMRFLSMLQRGVWRGLCMDMIGLLFYGMRITGSGLGLRKRISCAVLFCCVLLSGVVLSWIA